MKMVDWLHLNIVHNSQVMHRQLSSIKIFIRSMWDCRGGWHLPPSFTDVLPSPNQIFDMCDPQEHLDQVQRMYGGGTVS